MSHLYPAISPFTIYQLTYQWWLIYLEHTLAYAKAQEAKRGK